MKYEVTGIHRRSLHSALLSYRAPSCRQLGPARLARETPPAGRCPSPPARMGAAAPRRCLSPSPPPQSCPSHATRSSDRRGSLLRSPTGRTCSQSKSTSDRKAARHGEQHARPTEAEAMAGGGRGSGPVWVVEEHGFGLAVLKSRTAAVRMVRAVVALLALVRVAFTRAPDAKDPTCARLTVKVRSAQRHSASWKLEGIGRLRTCSYEGRARHSSTRHAGMRGA